MSMKNIALGKWVGDIGQVLHCSECGSSIMGGIQVEAVMGTRSKTKPAVVPKSMRFFSDKKSDEVVHLSVEDDNVFIFFGCVACKQQLMLHIKQVNSQIFMSIGLATG